MDYKSPITISINQIYDDAIRKLDDALMVKVQEQLEFDIDKDELLKALAYDRGQYKAGFDSGFTSALRCVISLAKERLEKELEDVTKN